MEIRSRCGESTYLTCPLDQPSTRQTYCSQYNSRVFSGKQYIWEPVTHTTDPCKVSCRARDEHFHANLAYKVEDGVPCKLGLINAVCIKGVCKPVGCDGVVESPAVKDTCGICKGDGSSCRTISGIFTSTDLKRGENYVISIPAGSTNISVTELQPSRNLLILQTLDGRTVINNDTNNPVSGVVEAAGTTFIYKADSQSNRKETIHSLGPTNTTVFLKVLVRGTNPGIMYTFSVPQEVSDTVIQQIRHRSRPVELPPEPDGDRILQSSGIRDGGSISVEKQTSSPSYSDSLGIQHLIRPPPKRRHHGYPESNTKPELLISVMNSPHTLEELTEHKFSEIDNAAQTQSNNFANRNSDNAFTNIVNPNSQYTEGNSNDLIHRSIQSSHDVRTLNGENGSNTHHERNSNFDKYLSRGNSTSTKPASELEDTNFSKANKEVENEVRKNVPSGVANLLDDVLGNKLKAHKINDNGNEIAEGDGFIDYSSGLSDADNEKIIDVLKDHQIRFVTDSWHSSEDPVSEVPIQSVRIPLSSLVDPKEVKGWNPDNKSYGNEKIRSAQITNAATSAVSNVGFEKFNLKGREAVEIDNEAVNRNQGLTQFSKMSDISLTTSAKGTSSNVAVVDEYTATQNDSSNEIADKMNVLNQSSLFVSPGYRSKYVVPRYSQSFKFAERYRETYRHKHKSRDFPRSNVLPYHRSGHRYYQHSSHNISTSVSSRNFHDQENEFTNVHVRKTEPVVRVEPDYSSLVRNPSKNTNAELGEGINEYDKSSHTNKSIQPSEQEKQNEKDEKINREMRLSYHQTALEERKRRMEQQRNRYNERLREYQERIRQRQAELAATRTLSLYRGTTLNNTNEINYGSSPHQRPGLFETNPSLQIPQIKNQTQPSPKNYSSLIHTETNPSHFERIETVYVTNEPDENLVKNSYVFSQASSHKDRISDIDGKYVPDLDNRIATYAKEGVTLKRHKIQQPNAREGDSNFNRQYVIQDSRTDVKDSEIDNETSSDQKNLPTGTHLARGENSETINEDVSQTDASQNAQNLHQPEPRQVPGSTLRAAEVLPRGGNQVSHTQPFNQISSDNHILANQLALERIPPSYTAETGDFFGQTPLNTHSIIYVWRVSGLTECTHSCGGGIQQTLVLCVDTMTQALVTDESCRHIPRPKILTVPCNTRPCSAEWIPGAWSTCTVSCGTGEQTRTVTCQARVSPTLNMTMPNSNCEGQERIPTMQTCSISPCSSWQAGIWSNCSVPCGDGEKTRYVQCVDIENKVVSDHFCTDIKPHSEKRCNLGECGKGWLFTEWLQECSAECGIGTVSRQVFCADETGSALTESRCDISQRPALTQPCRADKLCGGLWFTGQWSKCDAKCGSGNRRRHVLCVKEMAGVYAVVSQDNCEGVDKPAEMEPCQSSPCISEWYMSSWSQCSQSCGTGYRTRAVKCLGQTSADDCSLQTRPKTRDACNTLSCASVVTEDEAPDCTDTFAQCSVVKRARLCRYGYYNKICCKSCAEQSLTAVPSDIPV